MIEVDAFDIIAFVVFAVLLAAAVIIVVSLGSLPGSLANPPGPPRSHLVPTLSRTRRRHYSL
jgi:hypothetical protein